MGPPVAQRCEKGRGREEERERGGGEEGGMTGGVCVCVCVCVCVSGLHHDYHDNLYVLLRGKVPTLIVYVLGMYCIVLYIDVP